jgi:hypothetical protein
MASTGSNSSAPQAETVSSTADVVVALTSYNHERTIQAVARAVREDFTRHFRSVQTRVLLADAGSTDQTVQAARSVLPTGAFVELDVPSRGTGKRAPALRAALQAAVKLHARAVAIVDTGSVAPDSSRVERLVTPVLVEGFDYVSPCYTRNRYEGAITKAIVYPLFRALYGVPLRQPASNEFACSSKLVEHLLDQDFWDDERVEGAIGLWLASNAVNNGFRACEAMLGIRTPSTPDLPDLGTALSQVVGALFADVEVRADIWHRVRGVRSVAVFGAGDLPEPESAPPGVEPLIDLFRLANRELREIWTWVLPPATIVALGRVADSDPRQFGLDDGLWARIIYDFAFGYSHRVMPREHLLGSLLPLYSGWMASFILRVQDVASDAVEQRLDQVAGAFEAEKRHLVARWRWPERLRR